MPMPGPEPRPHRSATLPVMVTALSSQPLSAHLPRPGARVQTRAQQSELWLTRPASHHPMGNIE